MMVVGGDHNLFNNARTLAHVIYMLNSVKHEWYLVNVLQPQVFSVKFIILKCTWHVNVQKIYFWGLHYTFLK